MRFLKVLGLIVLFVLAMVFFIQNTEILSTAMSLKLDLFVLDPWTTVPLPFYILLLLAFALGGVFTLGYFVIDKLQSAKQLKECQKELSKLNQEVNSLRNLPLEDQSYSAPSSQESSTTQDSENKE